MDFVCEHCGASSARRATDVARARAAGRRLFCSRNCAGLARRVERTEEERRSRKAAYDKDYRERDRGNRRAKKAEYHRRTYDPDKARAIRDANAEAIRQYKADWYADPSNRERKRQYDEARRASEYADFAEAWRLVLELEREVRRLTPDRYERAKARRGPYWMNRRPRGELRT